MDTFVNAGRLKKAGSEAVPAGLALGARTKKFMEISFGPDSPGAHI